MGRKGTLVSEQFWTTTIAAVLAAIPPTMTSLFALWKLKKMHVDVNSRLTQLSNMASTEGQAIGELKGRKDQKREALTGKIRDDRAIKPTKRKPIEPSGPVPKGPKK